MALVVQDVGCDRFLKIMLNDDWPTGGKDLTLKLYTNNYSPLDTSSAANFTEAVGGDYAPKTLTCGSWTITPADDPSDAVYADQTFEFSGELDANATIYGYFIVDADGVIRWAEKLGTPFTPANNGDNLVVTPKMVLSKGTPTA